jgi:hypothetical protein
MVNQSYHTTRRASGHHDPIFCLEAGQARRERRRIETRRLAYQVEQDVDLMDTAVDEDAAPIEGAAGPPLGRTEWGLFLELDHPQVADSATLDQRFALARCRHKAVVLGHHQGNASLLGDGNQRLGLGQSPGDGLLHQDMLAGLGRHGPMRQMEVMRRTQVQSLYPRVGGRRFVRAEDPTPPEGRGVGPGPLHVAAREEELDLVPCGLHRLGKGAGERAAADHTQT